MGQQAVALAKSVQYESAGEWGDLYTGIPVSLLSIPLLLSYLSSFPLTFAVSISLPLFFYSLSLALPSFLSPSLMPYLPSSLSFPLSPLSLLSLPPLSPLSLYSLSSLSLLSLLSQALLSSWLIPIEISISLRWTRDCRWSTPSLSVSLEWIWSRRWSM